MQGVAAAVALEATSGAASDSVTAMEVDSSVCPPRSHVLAGDLRGRPEADPWAWPLVRGVLCTGHVTTRLLTLLCDAVGVTPLAPGLPRPARGT